MASILDRLKGGMPANPTNTTEGSSSRPVNPSVRAPSGATGQPRPSPLVGVGRPPQQVRPGGANANKSRGTPSAPRAPSSLKGFDPQQRSSGADLFDRLESRTGHDDDNGGPPPEFDGYGPTRPSNNPRSSAPQSSRSSRSRQRAYAPRELGGEKQNQTVVSGKVERIVYQSDNYFVLILEGGVKVSGKAAVALKEGTTVRARCSEKKWKGETQWQTDAIEEVMPLNSTDLDGIKAYLGSGAVEGVGKVLAEQIVSRFGADTFHVILNHRDRLLAIPGLGPLKISKIVQSVRAREEVNELMSFLAKHGIGPGIATRIVEHFEEGVRAKIEEDPYRLTEVDLVGFRTADSVALSMGVPENAPSRIRSAVAHCLDEATSRGNTMIATDDVIARTRELVGVPYEVVYESVRKLAFDMDRVVMRAANGVAVEPGQLPPHETSLTPRKLFDAERAIAMDIQRLMSSKAGRPILKPGHERASAELFPSFKKLDSVQQETALQSLSSKVSVITGGPGCGKTTVTRALVDIAEKAGLRVMLLSPTGRASRRMAEATGRDAHTIHYALQPGEGGFRRGRDNPLECDLLVVDEHGMTDTTLMRALMRAVPDGCRVIFVGDADQLPSVGPGNVLRDLISSGVVPTGRLKTVHRQAAGNPIVAASHAVIAGNSPAFAPPNCMFLPVQDQEQALHYVVECVQSIIRRGEAQAEQIQVLTPTHKGAVGTESLNTRLRDMLNPDVGQHKLTLGGEETRREFREGDRVMQLKNNRDAEISNGDMGYIRSIDLANDVIAIDFGGRLVKLTRNQMTDLKLAYACTVHKSQGSEFPVVIMTMMWGHDTLLNRNLIYTGMTRAKQRLVMIGERRALAAGIAKADADRRVTGLASSLRLRLTDNADILPTELSSAHKRRQSAPASAEASADDELKGRINMANPFDFDDGPATQRQASASPAPQQTTQKLNHR